MPTSFYDNFSDDDENDVQPLPLVRTRSWREYEGRDEIPMILNEGFLPVKFQGSEFQELDYEGAMRFYFEDGLNELSKAVRLTNKTSVDDLIPILIDKFSLPEDEDYTLFEVYEKGELVPLNREECPLARAISKQKVPRFVLKKHGENGTIADPEQIITVSPVTSAKKDKRLRLFTFGGSVKDKEEKPKKQAKVNKSRKKKDKTFIKITHKTESPDVSDIEDPIVEIKRDSNPYISFDGLEEIEGENISDAATSDTSDSEEYTSTSYYKIPKNSLESSAEDLSISVEEISPKIKVDEEEIRQETRQEVEAEIDDNIFGDEIDGRDENNNVKTRTLSFSNSSIFFDQDNDDARNIKVEYLNRRNNKKTDKKRKSRNSEKRNNLSISKMLKSQKKKDEGNTPTTELSTNKLAPGILKVFGDHVLDGSLYKAVRVSTISTAQEVVAMALERYGIENQNPKEYVLCDVVGQFGKTDEIRSSKNKKTKKVEDNKNTEEQKWTTEYLRAINDYEKPLVLQSLWKPTNGRSRRFELRKRVDVENSCFFINTADGMGRSNSETSLFNDSEHSSVASSEVPNHVNDISSEHKKDKKLARSDNTGTDHAPLYVPYLLLLHGNNKMKDRLVCKLDEPTNIVGMYVENDKMKPHIALDAPDILQTHCWLFKKVQLEDESGETNLDEINFLVYIEPILEADITVNGNKVKSTTLIKPGQLVGFGKHYLFLFKDPTQNTDITLNLMNNMYISNDNIEGNDNNEDEIYETIEDQQITSIQTDNVESVPIENHVNESEDDTEGSSGDELDENQQMSKPENLAPRKHVEKSRLQISYNIKEEDEILHAIIDVSDEELGEFKLTPAYLFMMVIEHSAATFTEIQTRKLLLKISSGLQGIAWEKTKEIGKQVSVKDNNPMQILGRVLPELKPVLFWMASALEMLHFLQCNLQNYLLPRDQVTTTKETLLSADEELLTVLEEVIMFTFQQTVYHLTKVLYAALPSLISTNPYETVHDLGGNRKQVNVHPDVANISIVFQEVLRAAKEHQVHPQIIAQLFSYLFFFSNASLFNSLMEKGPGKEFYNWNRGVQIRGNLDILEDWAQANGLRKQFEQYMNKFLCAVDLLSLPTNQLLSLDWRTLRQEYASLNPAQLQQLLGEYSLEDQPRPKGWYPPPEEVEPALRSSEVLESFATHPPLILPSGGFIIDLNKAPDSEEFFKYTSQLYERFNVDKQDNAGNDNQDRPAPKYERLKDDHGKPAKKSRHERSGSNVNMADVESAIQVKNETQVHSAPPESPGVEPSIKVTSKRSAQVKINVTSKPKGILVNGNRHDTSNEDGNSRNSPDNMEQLLEKANHLISNEGTMSSDDEEISGYKNGSNDDVFLVELERGTKGLGLGLIDGMFTSLKSNGIYIRTIVPNTPAATDTRLHIGDQILAVNDKSLVGSDYNKAMEIIKNAGSRLKFLVAKSDTITANQVLTT